MASFAEIVRQAAPDRYFSSLYAPADRRDDLHALYAFDAEVSTIRAKVSEPMLGEIRLTWWRDALEQGEGQGNPLAEAVLDVMARHALPMQALLDVIDARTFDLYDDPFPSLNDLEGHAGETRGRIMMLAGALLAPDMPRTGAFADAAGHGGVALLLRDVVAGSAVHDETRLPKELAAGDTEGRGQDGVGMPTAVNDVTAGHLAAFTVAAKAIPPSARPAFMPVALARLDLTRHFDGRRDPAPIWRRLWTLRRVARRGF